MPTDPINQIAETLAESLYHATTHLAVHSGIALAANSLANATQNTEAQENDLFQRTTSWLSPFPKVKKVLAFLGLEGLAHLTKKPTSRISAAFTPTAKKFFTPLVKKAIEPILQNLQAQGLVVVQDPIAAAKIIEQQSLKAAENANKLKEITLAATRATQAAAQAIKTAADAASKTVAEVKDISAQVNASWIPEWLTKPITPEWLKQVDFLGFVIEQDMPAPIPANTAEQAAHQTQSLINQAVNLARTAAKKAQATIELTQKIAEDLNKETASAFSAKVVNTAKNAGTYINEVMQDEQVEETFNNPLGTASRLLQRLERNAPQAGKTVADVFEKGVQGYHYSTSVAGSLVENVGEALGVSNPVALGILATAGILSYWGLKSGYNYMLTSTMVSNINTNHNVASAQPVVNVYNVTPAATEGATPKPAAR